MIVDKSMNHSSDLSRRQPLSASYHPRVEGSHRGLLLRSPHCIMDIFTSTGMLGVLVPRSNSLCKMGRGPRDSSICGTQRSSTSIVLEPSTNHSFPHSHVAPPVLRSSTSTRDKHERQTTSWSEDIGRVLLQRLGDQWRREGDRGDGVGLLVSNMWRDMQQGCQMRMSWANTRLQLLKGLEDKSNQLSHSETKWRPRDSASHSRTAEERAMILQCHFADTSTP